MSATWKRILLICAAMLIAAGFAFWADQAAYQHYKAYDAETELLDIFTDGSEAFDIYDCEIDNGMVTVTGGDPQFVVNTYDHEFSRVHIIFKEPVKTDMLLQVFYTTNYMFSEPYSVFRTIKAGQLEDIVPVPKTPLTRLRFDFERDVNIRRIYIGNEQPVILDYKPSIVRIGIIFSVIFIPICILILTKANKRKTREQHKLFWGVVFSNLFLTLVIVFFLPLDYIVLNIKHHTLPVWNIWWIQLLLALGATLVLSGLMLLLPLKGRWIASSLSLGFGLSFLIQSLLFNNALPFDMNTTWEMRLGCVMIWFWIVLLVVTVSYYYFEKHMKLTEGIIVGITWFLIAALTINFIMMAVSIDRLAREPGYLGEKEYRQYIRVEGLNPGKLEEDLMNISMNRGMPFLLKDHFVVDTDKINDATFGESR